MRTRTVNTIVFAWALGLVGLGLSLGTPGAWANGQKDAKACDEVKTRIRAIQDRMRSGYTASQGVKLDARLRRLKEKRRRVCG
ncbi:MAG: hypothetical protein AAFX10_09485 [Pseudomonadota bacterium]